MRWNWSWAFAAVLAAALGMPRAARASEADMFCYNGTSWKACQATNPLPTAPVPSSGITPIVSAALEGSHVFKGAAGVNYSIYVTTSTTPGYLMTFNATSAPADGAVTPIECVAVPASSSVSVSLGSGPPDTYSTGITAVFSTTGCFTKTVSATAFFKGRVQ